MRISDWSSDVCSSDLAEAGRVDAAAVFLLGRGQMQFLAVLLGDTQDRHRRFAGVLAAGQGIGQCVEVAAKGGKGGIVKEHRAAVDRKSVVEGKSVLVRVGLCVRRIIKKTKKKQ